MAAIVCGQKYAVSFVVGCYDDADAVEDAVLAQVFLVDAQHVRWRGRVGLHVIVELEAIDIAQVTRFVDAQDHRLKEAVETAEQVLRRYFEEVPRADRVLHRLKRGVFANALIAAEHQCVVDLLAWSLHPLRKPLHDMVGVIAKHAAYVIEPGAGVAGITWLERRRAIQIEAAHPAALDPAAFRD